MEDSPTDTPDLWMSERNEEDITFERVSVEDIRTKKTTVIVGTVEKKFKDLVRKFFSKIGSW
jgi:hypothetical protein